MMLKRQQRWATCILISLTVFGASQAAAAELMETRAKGESQLRRARLLFSFQGKSTSLAYDAGVVAKVFDYLPVLRSNDIVISGSSGGSILAVYFSRVGFSRASVDGAAQICQSADLARLRDSEASSAKLGKLMAGQSTELPPDVLDDYIARSLGLKDGKNGRSLAEIVKAGQTTPKFPLIIVAANHEVLDNRVSGSLWRGKNFKEVDTGNYSVSWKKGVFEYYQKHPEEFQKDNPDVKLGSSPYIGKACTYFVDETMFELLRQIPVEERLGDLRLVRTAEDMAMAILATCAEPTYLAPVPETDYSKLMVGDKLGNAGNTIRRSYCGAFLMPIVAQDVRRMLPSLRVFDTGGAQWPKVTRQVLQTWYLVDAQAMHRQAAWWVDFDTSPSDSTWQKIVRRQSSPSEEYRLGWDRAEEALQSCRSNPRFVETPKYRRAAKKAIWSPDDTDGGYTQRDLPTMRGLGEMIENTANKSSSTSVRRNTMDRVTP
jgi:hypothetical protein